MNAAAVSPRVQATYVAEVGSDGPLKGGGHSVYLARAICSRCTPEYKGPVRRAHGPFEVLAARDEARRDVLDHVDRVHDGRLIGR